MAHKSLPIRREYEGLLILEKVGECDSMHVAHNMMVHAVDEKEST
jgi:hypothetical protein